MFFLFHSSYTCYRKTYLSFSTACAAGYTGDGTTCTACAADTFLTSWVSGKACDACATGFSTGGATAQTTCTGIGK